LADVVGLNSVASYLLLILAATTLAAVIILSVKSRKVFSTPLLALIHILDAHSKKSVSKKPESLPKAPVGVGGLVLLVEDNPINQAVACGMLSLCRCKVDIASNGQEALEAFANQKYDLILMDCQMPVLDGYQATAAIRLLEKERASSSYIPIIALTAHSLQGDADKCLKAGMDDYFCKPFHLEGIKNILNKWLVDRPVVASTPNEFSREQAQEYYSEPLVADADEIPPINENILNSLAELQMEGESDFVNNAIQTYFATSDPLVEDLNSGWATQDMKKIKYSAHNLISSSAIVGAMPLSDMSRELDVACRLDQWINSGELVVRITKEYDRVRSALRNRLASTP
jgi:CheY-like chemotaxis protein